MRPLLFALPAALVLSGCATLEKPGEPALSPPQAHARTGAVSAADPRAQAAGEAILAKGGNATDAAIAVMLALTVVEPQSSGIGGGGFLVHGSADGKVVTFDGRETAPAAAGPNWFLGADGEPLSYREVVTTGLSVGVPGNIALAAKAHAANGSLEWEELFQPAIALARDGFLANRRLHQSLEGQIDRAGVTEFGRSLYYTAEGEPVAAGTRIVNPALAETLERIAALGPDHFYKGQYADKLAATVAAATPGGTGMTRDDVTSYEAPERDAVCGSYRDYRICGMGPPSSGGIAVIQILGQLERFDLAALGADNPVTWHLFVESQRLAYADRELYAADADFVSVPVRGLVARDYLAERSALISPDAVLDDVTAGRPRGVVTAASDGDEPPENGTSHFAVVDAEGAMISYTSTIEGPFGSGLTYGGFFLNNELTDFSFSPTRDGVPVANRVEGGKRPRSSMAPMVVYDPQGEPVLAIGAAGGSTIPVQTARSIIGIIDFGLDLEDALGLPFIMAFGDRLVLEEGSWLAERKEAFAALGHDDIATASPPLKAGGVYRTQTGWVAARDPRLDGLLETQE